MAYWSVERVICEDGVADDMGCALQKGILYASEKRRVATTHFGLSVRGLFKFGQAATRRKTSNGTVDVGEAWPSCDKLSVQWESRPVPVL